MLTKLEELLRDSETFRLQLLLRFFKLILSNLEVIGCPQEVLQIHICLRVVIKNFIRLLLLFNCAAHELVDAKVCLLYLLSKDFLYLLLIVWSRVGHYVASSRLVDLRVGGELLRRWSLESLLRSDRLGSLGLSLTLVWLDGEGDDTSTNLDCLSHLWLKLDFSLGKDKGSKLRKVIL